MAKSWYNSDFKSSIIRCNSDIIFRGNSDIAAMDGPNDFQKWLISKLDEAGHGSRQALANHIGITLDKLTRILNWMPGKLTREIKIEEFFKICDYYQEYPPGFPYLNGSPPPVQRVPDHHRWVLLPEKLAGVAELLANSSAEIQSQLVGYTQGVLSSQIGSPSNRDKDQDPAS